MTSFITELRRRNVLKIAAAYGLVAWILIEAGSVLLPTFGAPEWFFQVYVMMVLAGWVFALIVAWIYEVTPEGVKLERDIDRATYQPPQRSNMNRILIGLLIIALGVSLSFNLFGLRPQDLNESVGEKRDSVAVLPFDNRSSDPESQFFTDGIHDDLLTRLSSIESLRVISRTSVMQYRGATRNLRQIGDELDVSTIVEGAVQKYGDKVRITVQLINADTDEHIWAKSYDRNLTMENLFDIQSDISSEIAASLRTALNPEDEARLSVASTTDIDAYTLYAAGRQNLYRRNFDTTLEARRQFEQAIAIDPDYADAHAALAEAVMLLKINHKAIAPAEAYDLATAATSRALQLDPDLAKAHAVVGLIESEKWKQTRLGNGNQLATAAYRRAIELNRNLADTYVWYAGLLESESKFEEGTEMLRTALQVDPLSRIPYINLPGMLAAKGENEQAIELLLKAMTIFPDWAQPYEYMTQHLQRMGRLDESIAWNQKAMELTEDPLSGGSVLPIYQALGYIEVINDFAANFPSDHPLYPIGMGYIHFLNEEYEQALGVLEPVIEESEVPFPMIYPVLVRSAILLGDYDRAYEYLLQAAPALSADARPTIDRFSIGAVVLLAFLEQQRGNHDVANRWLERAHEAIQDIPRGGLKGHGIKDVQILALQDRPEAALDALRTAIDEGFVSLVPYELWSIDQDPMIDNLRNHPRYESMRLELEERMETMRRSIEDARASGDWQSLRDKTQST